MRNLMTYAKHFLIPAIVFRISEGTVFCIMLHKAVPKKGKNIFWDTNDYFANYL